MCIKLANGEIFRKKSLRLTLSPQSWARNRSWQRLPIYGKTVWVTVFAAWKYDDPLNRCLVVRAKNFIGSWKRWMATSTHAIYSWRFPLQVARNKPTIFERIRLRQSVISHSSLLPQHQLSWKPGVTWNLTIANKPVKWDEVELSRGKFFATIVLYMNILCFDHIYT